MACNSKRGLLGRIVRRARCALAVRGPRTSHESSGCGRANTTRRCNPPANIKRRRNSSNDTLRAATLPIYRIGEDAPAACTTEAAVNLVRIADWYGGVPAAATRRSRLAALQMAARSRRGIRHQCQRWVWASYPENALTPHPRRCLRGKERAGWGQTCGLLNRRLATSPISHCGWR